MLNSNAFIYIYPRANKFYDLDRLSNARESARRAQNSAAERWMNAFVPRVESSNPHRMMQLTEDNYNQEKLSLEILESNSRETRRLAIIRAPPSSPTSSGNL